MKISEKKWVCVHSNKVMDKSNFEDFIKESDNDKNSIKEAEVEYHRWRLLPSSSSSSPSVEEVEDVHPSLVQPSLV